MKAAPIDWSHLNVYLKLHFIVFIWGFTAILGKLISIPVVEVVFYRTAIAAIALFIILKFKKERLALERGQLLALLGTGFLIGCHWILFFLAARVSNVSICLAGMATASLWTSVLEPIVRRRPFKWHEPILSLLAVVGIAVVFDAAFDHALGLILAVVSAFLAAVFTIINSRLVEKHNHLTITMYEMVGACIVTVIFMIGNTFFFSKEPIQLALSFNDGFFVLILALLCTVYAYSASVKLMETLSAFAVNLTVNMEPVYGIILALFIFGESEEMGETFYLGTLIILSSVLLFPMINIWTKRSSRLGQ